MPYTPLGQDLVTGQFPDRAESRIKQLAQGLVDTAVSAYTEGDVTGEITRAGNGIHDLYLVGNTVVTLTGGKGSQVAFDVTLNGKTLTIAGQAIGVDGLTVAYRVKSGWKFFLPASSSGGTTSPAGDTTNPTSPTLTVDNTSTSQLVATYAGGTDAVGVTQYRVRIDGGAWVVRTSAGSYTFSGLAASSAHTIDAQAGDAAGNWSASTSSTKSTAAQASWQTIATDSFSGADGTLLTSHAASNGNTWSLAAAGQQTLSIVSNKAVGPAGTTGYGVLSLGGQHVGGVRVSATFANGGYPDLTIGYNSTQYGNGNNVNGGIALSQSGGAYTITGRGAGVDSVTITADAGKSLAGHAYGSVFTVEMATNGSFKVLVNGVQVGTGSVPGSLSGSRVGVAGYNTAGTVDDLLVEAFQ